MVLSPSELLQDACKKELSFLKSCLQVNPKSYSVWHHRQWIMEFMPQPDWKKEIHLCNLFLSYDERNCELILWHSICLIDKPFDVLNSEI